MVSRWRQQSDRVALVPTMGALHEGHLSLIRQVREHAGRVVVSIFLNPTQFGPGEDYESYPRTLAQDVELCRREGVSLVFAPDAKEMYGTGKGEYSGYISFRISRMTDYLCGASRSGHFEGVLQVVNKLFNTVQPDVAVFGQKDIQQWFLIRQMVAETDQPVEILMGPTRRESDGLAMSSRNIYLNEEDRKKAPMLYASLQRISAVLAEKAGHDDQRPVSLDTSLLEAECSILRENGMNLDYLTVVSTPDLQPADVIIPGRLYVVAVAAWLGGTRLIDNVLLNTNAG